MSDSNIGIVTERSSNRISYFNTHTLQVLYQINLNADATDVAITRDNRNAVVSTFTSQKIFKLNNNAAPPVVEATVATSIYAGDIDITPNSKYAVISDGGPISSSILSYDLSANSIVSTLSANAQAIAASPNGNGLILTATSIAGIVNCYNIDNAGTLTDTGNYVTVSGQPINITFAPDGNSAFIANDFSSTIDVLDTSNPSNITVSSSAISSSKIQSIVVSRDGYTVYVLTTSTVDIFNYNPTTKGLILSSSFNHNLLITFYYGVDQMALDLSEAILFIIDSSNKILNVFQTNGTLIGTVSNVQAEGGIAIYHQSSCRGIRFF